MKALLIVLLCSVSGCAGDVMRTVYCKNLCTDYLGIPENSMPLCAPEHLKMLECGTVITCDWAEAERDKVRPVANSSDILCCYRTTIKEKGDCAEPVASHPQPTQQQPVDIQSVSDQCPFQFVPWLLCIALLLIIALQDGRDLTVKRTCYYSNQNFCRANRCYKNAGSCSNMGITVKLTLFDCQARVGLLGFL